MTSPSPYAQFESAQWPYPSTILPTTTSASIYQVGPASHAQPSPRDQDYYPSTQPQVPMAHPSTQPQVPMAHPSTRPQVPMSSPYHDLMSHGYNQGPPTMLTNPPTMLANPPTMLT